MLCFRDTIYTRTTIPNQMNITCVTHGRYVIYYKNRTSLLYPSDYSQHAYTELCEVGVYGCPTTGYYDVNCSSPCPQNCQEVRCHIVDGTCLGCVEGYIGSFCNNCEWFGSLETCKGWVNGNNEQNCNRVKCKFQYLYKDNNYKCYHFYLKLNYVCI